MKTYQISCSTNISKIIFIAVVLAHSNMFTSQDDQTQSIKKSEQEIVSSNSDQSSERDFVRPIALSDIINGFYQGGKHLKKTGSQAGQKVYEQFIYAKKSIEEHLVIMADQMAKDQARRREMAEFAKEAFQKRMPDLQEKKEQELLIDEIVEQPEELLTKENLLSEDILSADLQSKDLLQQDLQPEIQELVKVENQHPNDNNDTKDFTTSDLEQLNLTHVALASAGMVGISFLTYKAYQYWIISRANPDKMIKSAIKNFSENELLKSIKILEKWTGLSLIVGQKQMLTQSKFSYALSKIDKVRSVKHKKLLYAQMLLMLELSKKSSRVIISKMALL
jgi:hypothetical protein